MQIGWPFVGTQKVVLKLRQFQVDAFASQPFQGNPAAVCPLEQWLPDQTMQAIAEENNLSETAFFVPAADGFDLRWFTPVAEVDFCGHATLASAHVLYNALGHKERTVSFNTRSGVMTVEREGELYVMNFPALPAQPCAAPQPLIDGLGVRPLEVLAADDYLVLVESEARLRSIVPDFWRLRELDLRGVIVTAPGEELDFVSRFFAPKYGIDEDPVTGSAHCALTPYWSQRLGKRVLRARQVSKRGGDVECEMSGDRVLLRGAAVTFMDASIHVDAR